MYGYAICQNNTDYIVCIVVSNYNDDATWLMCCSMNKFSRSSLIIIKPLFLLVRCKAKGNENISADEQDHK